ncbi:cysteine synthase [Desulfoferrobacter suflitae]|uniref:cysteine synthase n=1 Tax=Desulfoferrobacter suflitae TaxID=2865782 RepID=UPI002164ACC1|nr:cysteine synthase [Desulfoferrobacter suflitae]MCK8603066.1 cysteine synthase [Desulfoferrobacter suflitae]
MKNLFDNILGCIGNTPLVRLNRVNPNPTVTLYAKLEAKNPGGSIKDRPALAMIESAEKEGLLTHDKILIEATSGNTGIGLAIVAAVKGYHLLLAMPETASMERQKILKALGAELLLTPGGLGTDGAIEEVYNLVRQNPERYFMPDQFNNPANPLAHYVGTGPEIFEQTDGQVDVVIVTLGTTGTAMGIVHALKERRPDIEVIGIEPYPGHKIQGLKNMKESYVPGIFDRHKLDRIIHVRDEEAFEMARRLAREEGIFAGMSSGAAVAGAVQIASERSSGLIVAVLPDGGDRYLSTNLFTTMLEPDFCLFDVLQRKKIDFKPVQEGKVRIFVTGPPLDQHLTLQEARRFLVADLLSRFLAFKGFSVNQVMHIPDLDSRTIQGALAENSELSDYAQRQLDNFLADLDLLAIQRAYSYPRTSENLEAITEFVRSLIAKGFAYEKLRSVYYNISQSKDYGRLSKINLKKIRLGATVDLEAYEKLNPRDFTLLKRATLAELKRGSYVKTEWGNVLPTWHIAAASIALHHLGSPIDVQISSSDFLFPHLENIRAIGESLTGLSFAQTWMLCARIWTERDGKEQSHFDENLSIRELIKMGNTPSEIRYWLLSTHYRKAINATPENLMNATQGYHRLVEFIHRLQRTRGEGREHTLIPEMLYRLEQDFLAALEDDLNTPNALAALFKFSRQANPLLDSGDLSREQRRQILASMQKLDRVLGIFDFAVEPLDSEEEALIARREEARAQGRWEEADALRDHLRGRGIRVIDTPVGTRWERLQNFAN